MKGQRSADPGAVSQLLRRLSGSREPATDWNKVVAAALCHDLAPLLFGRLKRGGARASVPDDAWKRLRLAYLASAGRNMRLYRELRPVLQCLRSSGVPVIALKGAYLAEAVYGNVALRPMGDVDLMVPETEVPKARAVLRDMGGSPEQSHDAELHAAEQRHLPPVVICDLAVEIHWTIARPAGPFRIDAAGLWDRARPATIAGVDVLALSPEDLLLYLCLHFGYLHHNACLKSFCDIAETVCRFRGEMNWTRVVDLARGWGATRYVGLTLHLASGMLDTEVPGDVLERLVPGGLDQRMLEAARESVLTQTDHRRWMSLFDQWGARSLGDKARLTWKRVFLSRDEMAAVYPPSRNSKHLWPYYVLRLRDVIRTFGSHTSWRGLPVIRDRGRAGKVLLADWLK